MYYKRDMRKGKGSKEKGHGFERRAAKIFTKWSSRQFKRVPQSGGWAKEVVSGDIFCVDEYDPKSASRKIWVPFSLECKCAESWDFVHFFKDSDKSSLHQWWQQASSDAIQSEKLPALIFTRNYLPIFLMLHTSTLNRLAKLVGSSWRMFAHLNWELSKSDKVTILLLDDFLGWVSFETLLKLTV